MPNLYKGYVINPEPFWRPAYRISPFNTSFIKQNHALIKRGFVDNKFVESFFGNQFIYCESGKQAIYTALKQFHLNKEDEVWIITTSGNKYISSCVTNEIEKFCKWSREKSAYTKLIFVNHEFGFCYKELETLRQYGLPIIEDRALSLFSTDDKMLTGKIGDFVIYSLPKFFPISLGGLLQCNNTGFFNKLAGSNNEVSFYLSVLLSHYLKDVEYIKKKRRDNFNFLAETFDAVGAKPRFFLSHNEVPGVFMVTTSGINLPALKVFMQNNGVESSVFYGEEAFYVPVHQELSGEDMNFFFQLMNYFVEHGN